MIDSKKWRAHTVGVGPEEVAHGSVVGHFLLPVDRADLVEREDRRAEATVNTEDLSGEEIQAIRTKADWHATSTMISINGSSFI